jgi:hypothetical protein
MTQVQLLKRELFVDDDSTPALDALQFHTVTADDVKRLNESFYRYQCTLSRVAVAGAAVVVGGAALSAGGVIAAPPGGGGDASEEAAASIAAGVANAAMIRAIDGIGLAAFGVALAPMGFMVTLRVLNMVLSRV